MKTLAIATVILGTATVASAQPVLRGSDTLFGVVNSAINEAQLSGAISYAGGGSGLGETGLRTGSQGIAPMSREISPAGFEDLLNQGVNPIQYVLGLDGVSLYVKKTESVGQIDIPTIRAIYQTCAINDWSQVPNSGKTGPITVYRRDDLSGTTEVFRNLTGVTSFGPCVQVLGSTAAIAAATSADPSAIGYSGLSGHTESPDPEDASIGNKPLSVLNSVTNTFVAPTPDSIRSFEYPLSRRLFLNYVSEGREPSPLEQQLLNFMLVRENMDPILEANDFVPCNGSC